MMSRVSCCMRYVQTPIICICNDDSSPKLKTLKNYTLNIKWRKPMASQILPRIMEIARKEGLRIDEPTATKIIDSTGGDIRQLLNFLQMWRKANNSATFDEVKQK